LFALFQLGFADWIAPLSRAKSSVSHLDDADRVETNGTP
jgi:hypothetical protein